MKHQRVLSYITWEERSILVCCEHSQELRGKKGKEDRKTTASPYKTNYVQGRPIPEELHICQK